MRPTPMNSEVPALVRRLLLCACASAVLSGVLSVAQAQGAPAGTQPASASNTPATQTTTALPWGPPSDGMAAAANGGSYALLSRLQEENVLLDQQLKIAQKRRALEQLQAPANAPATEAPSSALSDLASMGGDPRVLLVQGHPGAARAMISLPGGGTVLAGVGDIVPQVGTIMSITANTVTVRTASNKVLAVPFWSSLENNSSQGGSSSGGASAIPPPIPRAPSALSSQGGRSTSSGVAGQSEALQ